MIYDAIMDELNHREVYLHEIYSPLFICSIGAHVWNIYNHKARIYYEGGKIPHMPIHLCFTAPAGFMKSFYIKQFIGEPTSILYDTKITNTYVTEITTAGLIGGKEYNKWTGIAEDYAGLLEEYSEGVIGIEEFDAITSAIRKDYNSNLEHQLLNVLDSGIVHKRTKYGDKKYRVFTTFWVGNQPERQINVSSGMGRRFVHMVYIPKPEEFGMFREKWWKSKGIRPSDELDTIRTQINNLYNLLELVKSVEFDDSVYKLYSELDLVPYEAQIMDRIIIGYTIMRYGVDSKLVLTADDKDLRDIINKVIEWRTAITYGADLMMVYYTIASSNSEGMDIKKLYKLLVKLNVKATEVTKYIGKLRSLGLITVKDGKLKAVKD